MFNYEWQKYIKQKYLDLAHAMQIPYHGNAAVILKDIEAANEMIEACEEYIAEQKAFLRDAEDWQ